MVVRCFKNEKMLHTNKIIVVVLSVCSVGFGAVHTNGREENGLTPAARQVQKKSTHREK